jgi:lysophospholipase L1-like esterase
MTAPGVRTLCFIGTTITIGTADRDALGWPGRLTRQLLREGHAVSHYNLGVPDQTLPILSKRAEREARARLEAVDDALIFLEPGHADLAILRDGRRRTDVTTFEAHLTMTMDALDSLAQVVLVGPTPVIEREGALPCPATGEMVRWSNTTISAVSRRMAVMAEERGTLYLDLFTEMTLGPAYVAAIDDPYGIAPTSGGHKLIADHAHAMLAPLFIDEDAPQIAVRPDDGTDHG